MKRMNKVISGIAVAILAVGIFGVLVWVFNARRHGVSMQCYRQVWRLSIAIEGFLEGGRDWRRTDEPLRAAAGSPSDLVCPGDARWSRSLKYEDLTEDMIAYVTWSWSELALIRKAPHLGDMPEQFLLVWEKNPNHGGKRNVGIYPGAALLLVDEKQFEEMFAKSLQFIESLRRQVPDDSMPTS